MNQTRGGGRRVLAIVAVLVALAGPGMTGLAAAAVPDTNTTDGAEQADRPMSLGVPAYWSARTPGGAADFDRLVEAADTLETVVVNGPASGPADPFDQDLATAVRRLRDRGVTVLGYVDTGYLGRTGQVTTRTATRSTTVDDWVRQADADAARWHELYAEHGLGGIFFDQTLSECGAEDEYLGAYAEITSGVWDRDSDATVAINPGTHVRECYTMVADIIVIAEDSLAAYRTWEPPAWTRDHPREMFWHLVHGASDRDQLTEALDLARARNAGHVFVTDAVLDTTGGPWNRLPPAPYWTAHRQALTPCP